MEEDEKKSYDSSYYNGSITIIHNYYHGSMTGRKKDGKKNCNPVSDHPGIRSDIGTDGYKIGSAFAEPK